MRQNSFLPLWIFDSYVSLIKNKIFFGTLRRISNLTNSDVTSWAFSCFLSPGLYGILFSRGTPKITVKPLFQILKYPFLFKNGTKYLKIS